MQQNLVRIIGHLGFPSSSVLIISHGTGMSLVANHSVRLVLVLTFRSDGLTCVNGRGYTSLTPLKTIDGITVIVLALPKPKLYPASRRLARGTVPIVATQDVEASRHAAYPGRVGREGVGRRGAVVVA